MADDPKHYVDLWTKQSQLFWQTVYQVPVLAGAMFAGWFALKSAAQSQLAQGVLAVGFLSMLVQVLILHRMSQYLNTFRKAADRLIPTVPSAFIGLNGYRLGVAVPELIAIFFAVLFWLEPNFKQPMPDALTQSSPNGGKLGLVSPVCQPSGATATANPNITIQVNSPSKPPVRTQVPPSPASSSSPACK